MWKREIVGFVVLALLVEGCATSSDSGTSTKDSGHADTAITSPVDSSSTELDTGTSDLDTGTSDFDTGSVAMDSGTVIVDTGTSFDSGPVVVDTGTFEGGTTDMTTGLACTSDSDCDLTGEGIAHCSSGIYVVGPLNPSAVCLQFDSVDVCTPTDATDIYFCDGDLGLCTKTGTNPAMCEPKCALAADGTWTQKCVGKNGCNPNVFGTDATTSKIVSFGTCQSGCRVDADCPSGSKCDPLQRFCSKTCTSDTTCKTGWSTAPANWGCDTVRGACTFKYTKTLGAVCLPNDCLCFKNSTETNGVCTSVCRAGDSCGTGYTCDALLPKKDTSGADAFTFTTQPTELVGYCLKNCTADTDCPANQACSTSAGLTQKTCRPK